MNKHSDRKSNAIDIFYTLFTDFLDDLNRIRPNDSTLFLVKNAIFLIPKETLVINFMEYISEFSHKILERDESFFINNTDFHSQVIGEDSFIKSEFDRIKEIWLSSETSDDSKEIIWNYLGSLVRFGSIAIN